jgi:NAD(P)-dependent dehydrogenase (short-subunit alcohol dehydrogenase family)
MTTSFGATNTAAQIVDGVDLTGSRAVVTGGSSGIGIETARALAQAGAEVTLAVRDVGAGRRIADEFGGLVGRLDLTDQASVAKFVADWSGPLHILVNNAGVMAAPPQRTREGWEFQFATNHLGHFALATGLHPALAEAGGARVVSLSSVGHVAAGVDFDDIHFERRPYDPMVAYGQSKTANALFAVAAATHWADDGITANAVHPGAILSNLTRYLSAEELESAKSRGYTFKTPEQGAATSVLVAASPTVDGITGRYFEDCQLAERYVPGGPRRGVADHATNPEYAERLWQVSLETIGR